MGRRRQTSQVASGVAKTLVGNTPTIDEDKENALPSINMPCLTDMKGEIPPAGKSALVLDVAEVICDDTSTTAASTPSSANPVSPTDHAASADEAASAEPAEAATAEGEAVTTLLRMPPPTAAPTIMPLSLPTLPPCPPGNARVSEPPKQPPIDECWRGASSSSYREKLYAAGLSTMCRNPLLERFANPLSFDNKVGERTPTVQTLGLTDGCKTPAAGDCTPVAMPMHHFHMPSPYQGAMNSFSMSPAVTPMASPVPLDLAVVLPFAPPPPLLQPEVGFPVMQAELSMEAQTAPGLLSILMPDSVACGFNCSEIAEQLRAAEPCSYDD